MSLTAAPLGPCPWRTSWGGSFTTHSRLWSMDGFRTARTLQRRMQRCWQQNWMWRPLSLGQKAAAETEQELLVVAAEAVSSVRIV